METTLEKGLTGNSTGMDEKDHVVDRSVPPNWSMFRNRDTPRKLEKKKPLALDDLVINVQTQPSEEGYEAFRLLSHKVSRVRYDVPWDHSLVVAFTKSESADNSLVAVGVLVFKLGDKQLSQPKNGSDFMDDYYHQVAFIFVDMDYQKSGVGSLLMKKAISVMKTSGLRRPLHLEGSKSAVKFFTKSGFSRKGKLKRAKCSRGSHLFLSYFDMHCQI